VEGGLDDIYLIHRHSPGRLERRLAELGPGTSAGGRYAGNAIPDREGETVIASAETDGTEAALRLRVADLEAQLRRERSRRLGVERGLDALSERLAELQRENAELRRSQRQLTSA
jgi:hypothetical protein